MNFKQNLSSHFVLHCRDKKLDLTTPKIMGILNLTPDSFSDGGHYIQRDRALKHALQMIEEGAAIIDLGGESTRPGSAKISVDEELDRVLPVLEKLRQETDAIISIDTSKPEIMRAAITSGADLINDINALQAEGALAEVQRSQVAVCLMHKKGESLTMQNNPQYENIVLEVKEFLQQRVETCLQAGINSNRFLIDPGFGFGKSMSHNLILLKHLSNLESLKLPILVGWSRKATLGEILQCPPSDRLYGSLAAAMIAIFNGTNIIRVHDVKATADALKVVMAVMDI